MNKLSTVSRIIDMNRKAKIGLSVAVIFAVILILLNVMCNFFINLAFSPIKPENALDSQSFVKSLKTPYTGSDPVEILNENLKNESYPWLKSVSKIASIKSFDNLNLNGYISVREGNHKYAVVMHGYHSCPQEIASYAKEFYDFGYNILVPGQRGHGWSEGNIVDMSAFTNYDVQKWCEYICDFDPKARIVLFGVSMGASTVMRATGLDLPENVVCCVEDCGFSSVWDEFEYQLKNYYHVPVHPVLDIVNFSIKRKLGFDCKKVSAKDDLKRAKIPVLFIHGTADDYVPFYMLSTVYDSATVEKEKLEIEGASHARAAFVNPDLYWKTVKNFLDKTVKN